MSLSNAFSPEPTPPAAGKHTHERSHSRPARAHGCQTRAARRVHERARPTASAGPGAARQLSAPCFHSNPLPTTLFLHFRVKAVHIPGHPLHTFDCVLATVRRHSKNKQTKKPPCPRETAKFLTRLNTGKKKQLRSYKIIKHRKRVGDGVRDMGRDGFCSESSLREQRRD